MNTDWLRVVRLKSYNELPYVDEAKIIYDNNSIRFKDNRISFFNKIKQIQFYNNIFAICEERYFRLHKNIKINGEQTYGEILFIKIIDGDFYGLSIEETDLIIYKLREILDNISKQQCIEKIERQDAIKPSDKVYYLEIEVNFAEFFDGKLERFHKDLFYSLESARNKGTKWLKNIIDALCYQIDYFELKEEDEKFNETVERYIESGILQYKFTIMEVEPLYASSYSVELDNRYKSKEECILNDKPTEIINFYNYDGTLQYKQLQWKDKKQRYIYSNRYYEGDELEEAGTKFKIGDFVKVKGDYLLLEDTYDYISPSEIFVIKSIPIKKNGKFIDENKYGVSNIRDNKISYIDELYEHDIELYNEPIDDNSPYMLLRKIYKNEIKVNKDILEIINFIE